MRGWWLAVLCLMWPAGASAHPHAFIDVQSAPVFDAQGRIVALRQHWVFDQYYTELSLPDFDANGNKKLDPPELAVLAQDNLANLKDYGYFTVFEAAGQAHDFDAPQEVRSTLEHGQVGLRFRLPLRQPVNPAGVAVAYRIYDPSYYIAMLHKNSSAVTLEGAPAGCGIALKTPEPDAVWVTLAAGLDKAATAPDNLGKYFAQTVAVTCR